MTIFELAGTMKGTVMGNRNGTGILAYLEIVTVIILSIGGQKATCTQIDWFKVYLLGSEAI